MPCGPNTFCQVVQSGPSQPSLFWMEEFTLLAQTVVRATGPKVPSFHCGSLSLAFRLIQTWPPPSLPSDWLVDTGFSVSLSSDWQSNKHTAHSLACSIGLKQCMLDFLFAPCIGLWIFVAALESLFYKALLSVLSFFSRSGHVWIQGKSGVCPKWRGGAAFWRECLVTASHQGMFESDHDAWTIK